MYHAFAMRCFECAADLKHDLYDFMNREFSAATRIFVQVLTLDVFHGDEAKAGVFAEVVDANDILVGDLSCNDDLLLEALQHFRACGQISANGFDSDGATQFAIFCFVDRSHPTLPKKLKDLVAIGDHAAFLQSGKIASKTRIAIQCDGSSSGCA